jgi:hypothetical protein
MQVMLRLYLADVSTTGADGGGGGDIANRQKTPTPL